MTEGCQREPKRTLWHRWTGWLNWRYEAKGLEELSQWADWATVGSLIVGLIALVVEGARIRRGQRHELAAMYIQRYWEIDDDFSHHATPLCGT